MKKKTPMTGQENCDAFFLAGCIANLCIAHGTMLGAVKALVSGGEPPEDFNKSVREAGALLLKNNAARGRLQAEAFAITGECHIFVRTAFYILKIM